MILIIKRELTFETVQDFVNDCNVQQVYDLRVMTCVVMENASLADDYVPSGGNVYSLCSMILTLKI